VTGRLFADASRFDRAVAGPATAEQPDTPDYGGELSALVYDHGLTGGGLGPAVFAAHELALTLRSQKVFVLASRALTVTPLDARPLATVASPRLPILLRLMDVPSDDLFAELLTKQLGYHFVHRGTLAAGALQIREALATAFHLAPLIYDGSGLDKADRSSPEEIVALLRKVWRTADGSILHGALPVVGRTGTVQTIGVNTPAAGRCSAKTGTLNYVTNLAGYCAAADHHTLAFALMIDGPGNWTALTAISRIVGAIAAY
jgi:D-alanyl-D-alanine carboxypeptidase/D-alanyl-D-alanine-endopeptidase (penicillin-binding protein 4)